MSKFLRLRIFTPGTVALGAMRHSGPAATSVFAMLAITANPASPIAVLPPPTALAFFPRRPSLVFRQDRLIVELAHRALEAQTPPRIAAA